MGKLFLSNLADARRATRDDYSFAIHERFRMRDDKGHYNHVLDLREKRRNCNAT